jgi:restriction system protein
MSSNTEAIPNSGMTSLMKTAIFDLAANRFSLFSAIVSPIEQRPTGELIRACAMPWQAIVREIQRDPEFLRQFSDNPRKFEEFIAAAYDRAGFDEVILTPRKGDLGRDVIAVKHGFGSIRFLEQTKAYKPGHLVTLQLHKRSCRRNFSR